MTSTDNHTSKKITNDIASTVAFLIGVKQEYFAQGAFSIDKYNELKNNESAVIIRNLSDVRTSLEQNFADINGAIRYGMKHLSDLPQYISSTSLAELERVGIVLDNGCGLRTDQYIININKEISDRIHTCKECFPAWLPWKYIRSLFIMPEGTSESGVKKGGQCYYARKKYLPYQVYLNWPADPTHGNILRDDLKFLTLLYRVHHDKFTEYGRVTDVIPDVKNNIIDFLCDHNHVVFFVDCENADPYKAYGMLTSLSQEQLRSHVAKIVLYDDPRTSSAWNIFEDCTEIPVQHELVQRVKSDKSLVDHRLTAGIVRERYESGMDGCVLIASDSDYWGVISATPDIDYIVMMEAEKSSDAILSVLNEHQIAHCWLDDFCTSESTLLANKAILADTRRSIVTALKQFNLRDSVKRAIRNARIPMSEQAQAQFYSRYYGNAVIRFDTNGAPILEFGC